MHILDELIDAISVSQNCNSPKISRKQFMQYLFSKSPLEIADDKYYYGLFNISNVPRATLNDLSDILNHDIMDWSFSYLQTYIGSNLNENDLNEKLFNICKAHSIKHSNTFDSMLESIVKHYFFDDKKLNLLFPECKIKNCNFYISWREKEEELLNLLQQQNIVFLTGKPASGKKELIKHIYKTYCDSSKDIFFCTSGNLSISDQLQNQIFEDSKYSLDDILYTLKSKGKSSLLILTRPILSDEDISFIKENLQNLEMRFIITTSTPSIPSVFSYINIDDRPYDNLQSIWDKILDNTSSKELLTPEEFQDLCDYIDKNPYLLTIIAQIVKREPKLINESLDFKSWLWNHKNLPKFHATYHSTQKTSLNPRQLILRLLDCYPDQLLEKLSELSIWTKHPLKRTLLEKYFNPQLLDCAVSYSILQIVDEDNSMLVMPKVLADTIWYKYPIKYEEYKESIQNFIFSIKSGTPLPIPYKDLYPVILNLIFRFHFQITNVSSRIVKREFALLEEWNELLLQLIYQIVQLGNPYIARQIVPHLFCYQHKSQYHEDSKTEHRMIRYLIDKQTEYMTNDNITAVMKEIQGIAIPLLEPYTANEMKITLSCVPYLTLIIQDLLDAEIRQERHLLINNDSGKDAFLILSMHLKTSIKLFKSMSCTLKNDYIDFSYYYSFIYYLIFCPYDINCSYHYHTALMYFEKLLDSTTASMDLKIKARCMHLYYNIFINKTTDVINHVNEYICLFKEINQHLYSWDTIFAFHSCYLLLQEILPKASRSALAISTHKIDFHSFIQEQMSLPSAYLETLLNLANRYE